MMWYCLDTKAWSFGGNFHINRHKMQKRLEFFNICNVVNVKSVTGLEIFSKVVILYIVLRMVLRRNKLFFERNLTCYLHRKKKARASSSTRSFLHSSPSSSLLSCVCWDPRSATPSAPSPAPCRNRLVRAIKVPSSFGGAFLYLNQPWFKHCGDRFLQLNRNSEEALREDGPFIWKDYFMLFISKEKGQGLVEYAIILAFVALVVISVVRLLGPRIGNTFSTIASSLPWDQRALLMQSSFLLIKNRRF